jgi:hypothetical protein
VASAQIATTESQIVRQVKADVPAANAPSSSAPRGGTKLVQVVELLKRDDGAALDELVLTTGWLSHATRAALTGASATCFPSDLSEWSIWRWRRLTRTISRRAAASALDASRHKGGTSKITFVPFNGLQ